MLRNPLVFILVALSATLALAWFLNPDRRLLNADPVTQLHRQIQASPALGAALVTADRGDSTALVAWLTQAERIQRRLLYLTINALAETRMPKDAQGKPIASNVPFHQYRHRLLAFTVVPTGDPGLDAQIDNNVAYQLVAGPMPPTAADLAQAKQLLPRVLANAKDTNEHTEWDTVGCVQFALGDFTAAKDSFNRAVTQAQVKPGSAPPSTDLYRRRLAAAEANAKRVAEKREATDPLEPLPAEVPEATAAPTATP